MARTRVKARGVCACAVWRHAYRGRREMLVLLLPHSNRNDRTCACISSNKNENPLHLLDSAK